MTRKIPANDFEQLVGVHLGVSGWHEVGQSDVDAFGELTGDRHWVHMDAVLAKQNGFGRTIVHGPFTLALVTRFAGEVYEIVGATRTLNYGYDQVRFPSPLPSGSRIRAGFSVAKVVRKDSGLRVVFGVTVHREGSDVPVCVAQAVTHVVIDGQDAPAVG